MKQYREKRRYDRHDRLDAVLIADENQGFTRAVLLNYSQSGLYIKSPRSFAPGQQVRIETDAPVEGKIPETCRGRIVWCSPVIGKHPHFRAGIRYYEEDKG